MAGNMRQKLVMKSLLLFLILSGMYPGKREILLFYKEEGAALQDKQLAILHENEAGLKERDIIIHTYHITKQDKEAAKWKVQSSASFIFLLIGKDGGEKLRSDSIVSAEKLFDIIDAMPMRKAEMKHSHN